MCVVFAPFYTLYAVIVAVAIVLWIAKHLWQ